MGRARGWRAVTVVLWLLGVGFVASATPTKIVADDEPDYWSRTRFSYELLAKDFFNNKECYSRENDFLGCVYGLNALAAQLKPAAIFIPASLYKEESNEFGPKLADFGALFLVETVDVKREFKSGREYYDFVQNSRERLNQAIRAIYKLAVTTASDTRPFSVESALSMLLNRDELKVKARAKAGAAVNAYVQHAVDPHARYQPLAEAMAERQASGKNYGGIGLELAKLNKEVVVTGIIDESPASRSTLQESDRIIRVNGQDITDLNLDEVVGLIKGEVGTSVDLTVVRDGKEQAVTLKREKVQIKIVSGKMINHTNRPTAYVQLKHFMEVAACGKIRDEVKALESKGAKGLILDLRSNPGGLLPLSVCITGLFVGQDKIAVEVRSLDRRPLIQNAEAGKGPIRTKGDQITKLPMVVLINAGSASASEIVSGALRDHKRAWLVGQRSFGKGSVQTGDPVSSDENHAQPDLLFFKTTARFYQPNGTSNHLIGIRPDFEVPLRRNMTADDTFAPREAELVVGTLTAVNEEPKPIRADEAAKVRDCVEKRIDRDALSDQQLLFAENIFHCL